MYHGNDAVKGNLSSTMHSKHELLVVKQRVVTTICHGVSISQVGAKPLLLLLSPTEAAVRGRFAAVKHSC